MALTHHNFNNPKLDYFDRQHRDMVTRIYERSLLIKHCGSGLVSSYLPTKRYRPPTKEEPSFQVKTNPYYLATPTTNPYHSSVHVANSGTTYRILKHACPETALERAKREIELDDEEIRELARREYLVYRNRKEKAEGTRIPNDVKRFLRGKSPTTISTALLMDSDRNLNLARKEQDIFTRHAIRELCSSILERRTLPKRQPYVPVHKYFKY